jgi:hypothetical protein
MHTQPLPANAIITTHTPYIYLQGNIPRNAVHSLGPHIPVAGGGHGVLALCTAGTTGKEGRQGKGRGIGGCAGGRWGMGGTAPKA